MSTIKKIRLCPRCEAHVLVEEQEICPLCSLDAEVAHAHGWREDVGHSRVTWDSCTVLGMIDKEATVKDWHPTRDVRTAVDTLLWLYEECKSGIDFELLKDGEKRVCQIHYKGEVTVSAEVTDDYALPICKAIIASGVAAETDCRHEWKGHEGKTHREPRQFMRGPEPHWAAEEEARAAAFPG